MSWHPAPSVASTWNVYVPSVVVGEVLTLNDEVMLAPVDVAGLLPKLAPAPPGRPVSAESVTVQGLLLPFSWTVTVPKVAVAPGEAVTFVGEATVTV